MEQKNKEIAILKSKNEKLIEQCNNAEQNLLTSNSKIKQLEIIINDKDVNIAKLTQQILYNQDLSISQLNQSKKSDLEIEQKNKEIAILKSKNDK